jgi:hypothetical protein
MARKQTYDYSEYDKTEIDYAVFHNFRPAEKYMQLSFYLPFHQHL